MAKEKLYYLDAETRDGEYRITTFSFRFEDLMRDFSEWLRREKLTFKDMAYAIICKTEDEEPVAVLESDEDGAVMLRPVQENTGLIHGIKKRLKTLFR